MKIAYVTDSGTGKSIAEMAKDGIISVPLQISDEKIFFCSIFYRFHLVYHKLPPFL